MGTMMCLSPTTAFSGVGCAAITGAVLSGHPLGAHRPLHTGVGDPTTTYHRTEVALLLLVAGVSALKDRMHGAVRLSARGALCGRG